MTDVRFKKNPQSPRVAFFGMRCAFSAAVLKTLLEHGIDIACVFLAASEGELAGERSVSHRFLRNGTVEALAQAAELPVRVVDRLGAADFIAALAHAVPGAIATACFPWRLPPEVLAIPRLGALNVHPSLLPRHRGPEPLFWTFRHGDQHSGVTVHLMTDQLDAGPIVAQSSTRISSGMDGRSVERQMAESGGQLLAQAMVRRGKGDLSATEQDETAATTEGFPSAADLVIDTNRTAISAFSFVRGVGSLGFRPVVYDERSGNRIEVGRPQWHAPGNVQIPAIIRNKDIVTIQFSDGICGFAGIELRKTFTVPIDIGSRIVR